MQQQRRHPIRHRTLPHPRRSELALVPGNFSFSSSVCLPPDSGHFLRPFPTASPEDPSLSPTSELLPPLSQLDLSDSVSAGLDRQYGLWALGCPPISFSAQNLTFRLDTEDAESLLQPRPPRFFPSQITGTFGQIPGTQSSSVRWSCQALTC